MFSRVFAGLAAVSLAASPTLAQATAAPLSIQPAAVERAGAAPGDSQLNGGSWLPPVLFAAIVIAGVLMATGVIFDDDPDSP